MYKNYFLIKNTRDICTENCPVKTYFNDLKKIKFTKIEDFLKEFYVPYETSIEDNSKINILFIGEAPGEKETLNKRPFYPKSNSGNILRTVIRDMGIDQYAIANIVSCRPVYIINNKYRNRTPVFNECQYCSCYLRNFIFSLNEKLTIILLGKTAVFTVFGDRDCIKHYSSISSLIKIAPFKHNNRVYGANFHPRYIVNGGGVKSKRYKDYLKRMEEIINA